MSMTSLTAGQLRWSLERTADICVIPIRTLREWVAVGLLRPVVAGGKGGVGKCHLLSTQQLYGLVVVDALIRSQRGCGRSYARSVLECFQAMTESVLEVWMGERTDDYAEEAVAAWTSSQAAEPCLIDRGEPALPGDDEAVADMTERHYRIDAAIRERLGQPSSRTAGRSRASSRKVK